MPTAARCACRDVGARRARRRGLCVNTYLSGQPTVLLGVIQRPGSNALAAAAAVKAEMDAASKTFPPGLEYRIIYNPTEFISQSIDAVQHTLLEAIALVVLVIIVFLQRWRAAVIPVVAIPVSLIGTFAVLLAVGYSLNNLSLFGLVLAIGIVVDDAIVVVENVERNLARGLSGLEAARTSMDEVGAALVAIVLVLCAVFVPTLFLSGLAGAFYHQFAVTISAATVISLLVSLTLSPALAALLLKPHSRGRAGQRGRRRFACARATASTAASTRFSDGYANSRAGWSMHAEADDGRLCRPDRRDRRPVLGSRRPASFRRRTRAIC